MKLKLFQIDAFTNTLFKGNPAAVCPLDAWLPDTIMQAIAEENNLSETAFFVQLAPGEYQLRWFTPVAEVSLCGHATLASAFVIFSYFAPDLIQIIFQTKSGVLQAHKTAPDKIQLTFPALACDNIEVASADLKRGLGDAPIEQIYRAQQRCLVLMPDEAAVQAVQPEMSALKKTGYAAIIITAPSASSTADFVSRYFVPAIPKEDPVTGAAHCVLTPYWSQRLGKTRLTGRQLSRRGGMIECELAGTYVKLTGAAILFMTGVIDISPELT